MSEPFKNFIVNLPPINVKKIVSNHSNIRSCKRSCLLSADCLSRFSFTYKSIFIQSNWQNIYVQTRVLHGSTFGDLCPPVQYSTAPHPAVHTWLHRDEIRTRPGPLTFHLLPAHRALQCAQCNLKTLLLNSPLLRPCCSWLCACVSVCSCMSVNTCPLWSAGEDF